MTQAQGSSDAVLAMVALSDYDLPDETRIFDFLEESFPDAPDVSRIERNDDTIVFKVADLVGTISLMPTPIPWTDLEGPCATAWYWPEATEAMKKHTAHVIVGLFHGTGDIISRHILLTQLVASVAATSKSAGVYWGSGTVVNSSQDFVEQSLGAGPDNLPLSLWIDFRVEHVSKDTFQLYTTGMTALNQLEIEVPPSEVRPSELLDIVYGLADYVLTSRATIKDGDTFGRSEKERFRITYSPSMWDASKKVMKLNF
jgi:hypothetical protein